MTKSSPIFYLDGTYLPLPQAVARVLTPGETVLRGVFETIRVLDGKAEFLVEHLARLEKGLKFFNIKAPVKPQRLRAIIRRVIVQNKTTRLGRLRVIVFQEHGAVHMAVMLLPYEPPSKQAYDKGLKLKTITISKPWRAGMSDVKSLDYGMFHQAYHQARAEGYDDALLINAKGNVVESARANLFIFLDGRWITPSLSSGCLNGIIRVQLIKLARRNKIQIEEADIRPAMVRKATAVFLTNSLMGIIPVSRID